MRVCGGGGQWSHNSCKSRFGMFCKLRLWAVVSTCSNGLCGSNRIRLVRHVTDFWFQMIFDMLYNVFSAIFECKHIVAQIFTYLANNAYRPLHLSFDALIMNVIYNKIRNKCLIASSSVMAFITSTLVLQ